MKLKESFSLMVCLLVLYACNTQSPKASSQQNNVATEDFDFANADPAAVELADSIMAAMGGKQYWDAIHYLQWNTSDNRMYHWDKKTGRIRIESYHDSTVYLMDLNTLRGRTQIKEKEVIAKDSLRKMLLKAKSIWTDDVYALVMPYKLKDSGIILKYLGEDTLMGGARCNVLEVTFKNAVGTPQNKYRVYVDLRDNLVKQWAYYPGTNTAGSPDFVRPWDNYKKYGNILLSADRSDGWGPTQVSVSNIVPEKIFREF